MNAENTIPEELLKKINEERAGHAGSGKHYWPRWIREALLKFYADGMSGTDIAAVTGISTDLIYSWAKKYREREKAALKRAKFSELRVVQEAKPSKELRVHVGSTDIFGFTVKTLTEFLRETGQLGR